MQHIRHVQARYGCGVTGSGEQVLQCYVIIGYVPKKGTNASPAKGVIPEPVRGGVRR